eukprot:c12524_g1_i2.p1 GENE.c12524_g1_i2~~c12524_g1_i2.p1  ORF type:complete len:105 (+),score=34.77 c12524_g1_i2:35-349(+)
MTENNPQKVLSEEEIQEALSCPCLDSMKNSPCSTQFMTSFECFIRSTNEVKGEECVEMFSNMQKCFEENKEHYDKMFSEEGDQVHSMLGGVSDDSNLKTIITPK